METFRDDEEQAEILRKWWAENGVSIVVAVVLAVSALLGMRYWNQQVENEAGAASEQFEQLMNTMAQAQTVEQSQAQAEKASQQASKIIEQWPGTAYANFSDFILARMAVEQADYELAAEHLQNVVDDAASTAIESEALVRLARVQLAGENYEQVLTLLSSDLPAAWMGQVWELRGDALLKRDKLEQARAAYASALESMEPGDSARELVKMKLNEIASS